MPLRSTGALTRARTAWSRFMEAEQRFQAQTHQAYGDLGPPIEFLVAESERGNADLVVHELERLLDHPSLSEFGRSALAHQLGVALDRCIAGDRLSLLRKAEPHLRLATQCPARKRHLRAHAESCLHLSLIERQLARFREPEHSAMYLNRAAGHLDDALRALRRLGPAAGFHVASAMNTMGNLALEGCDFCGAMRNYDAALHALEKRLRLRHRDPTFGSPIELGIEIHAKWAQAALGAELPHDRIQARLLAATSRHDHPRLRLQLALVTDENDPAYADHLRAAAHGALTHPLPHEGLVALARELSSHHASSDIDLFFAVTIEALNSARTHLFGDQEADHTALRMQELAGYWARAKAPMSVPEAFCIIEVYSAIRLQEACRIHGWIPTDSDDLACFQRWFELGGLSSAFAALAHRAEVLGPEQGVAVIEEVRRLTTSEGGDPPDGLGDFDWQPGAQGVHLREWAKLGGQPTPAALRERAQDLDAEATDARLVLESNPSFIEARNRVMTPIYPPLLEDLLSRFPDTGFLRMELVGDRILGLFLWYRNGQVVPASFDVPLPVELEGAVLHQLWATGRLSPDVLASLEGFDLVGHLTQPVLPPRLVLMPSRLLALLPLLVMGGPRRSLLDHFEAIQWLSSLAPLRSRVIDRVARAGTIELYPGRGLPYFDVRSTPYAAIPASAMNADRVLSDSAGRDEVLRHWSTANVLSFYGHGEHVMPHATDAPEHGPQIQLQHGETLSPRWLQEHTFGVERVELWACKSGIDFPTDPLFPMANEGFGLDYALLQSGTRTTIGTLWSVDELPTALICLKHRLETQRGADAAAALRLAQLWWRDVGRSSIVDAVRTGSKPGDAVAALWEQLLGTPPPMDATAGVVAYLNAKPPDEFLEHGLGSDIAYAAYRFSGVPNRPVDGKWPDFETGGPPDRT